MSSQLPDQGREAPTTVRTTGIGSMPGRDAAETTRIVVGELDIPHLVELPARGPGADMVGRALALIRERTGEFAAETTTTGWRLAGGRSGGDPGRAMRRGTSWLAEDCDRLEEQLQGFAGTVKVQVTGPWSIAAAVETGQGHRLVADPGACADLAAALSEAAVGLLRDLRRRLPMAELALQVDEPSLPTVLAGRVRTPSGRGAVRTPELAEVVADLRRVTEAARATGIQDVLVHCCAPEVPFDVLHRAAFSGVSIDLDVVADAADEALGSWWDAGGTVVLGVAPSLDPSPAQRQTMPESFARRVSALWQRIGFGVADVGARTWLSPSCGLAGASPTWAREVGPLLGRAVRMLESAE